MLAAVRCASRDVPDVTQFEPAIGKVGVEDRHHADRAVRSRSTITVNQSGSVGGEALLDPGLNSSISAQGP